MLNIRLEFNRSGNYKMKQENNGIHSYLVNCLIHVRSFFEHAFLPD